MNNLDKQYKELVQNIIDNGIISEDRTGTGTKKIFGNILRHKMVDGFPLLTSKKIFWKGIIHELLWFIRGDTNIKYLVDNNVNIWVGDCYKKYINYINNISIGSTVDGRFVISQSNTEQTYRPMTREEFIETIKNNKYFAEQFGELGIVYGAEWVNWAGQINQIKELIETLKTNPDSRRMLVTAWNPINVKKAVLPPCHYCFQVVTHELTLKERLNILPTYNAEAFKEIKFSNFMDVANLLDNSNVPKRTISLMFNMRSVDVALGLPFDIASYAFLLSMIAQCVNMIPNEVICCSADTHIYLNQFDGLNRQMQNQEYNLPFLKLNNSIKNIFDFSINDFIIENYISCDKINIPLSN